MWTAFFVGLITQASLIISIGAQNSFVLRQGLLGRYVGLTVWFCILSDVALAFFSVYGLTFLTSLNQNFIFGLQIFAILFLCVYATLSFLRAVKGHGEKND